VIVPLHTQHFICGGNMLYTAITRGKNFVVARFARRWRGPVENAARHRNDLLIKYSKRPDHRLL
jgi:ATP-dependent exoDNAse (exonuclease V) alpha subunit